MANPVVQTTQCTCGFGILPASLLVTSQVTVIACGQFGQSYESQWGLMNDLFAWLDLLFRKPGEQVICLSVGPGTGKCFQVEHLMSQLLRAAVGELRKSEIVVVRRTCGNMQTC